MADWRAAVIAGIVAGIIFLVVNMGLSGRLLGNAQLPLQLSAAMVMGAEVLPPAVGLGGGVFATGIVIHLVLSVLFACVIAFCLHRWGIWVGILGGALFGLALYSINYYFMSGFFPGLAPLRGWLMALSHIIFGACAGGIYEALERDRR